MTEDSKRLLYIIRYAGSDAGKSAADDLLVELKALRSVAAATHAFMRANHCDDRDCNISEEGVLLQRDDIDCDECHAIEQMREALAMLQSSTGEETKSND